MFNPMIDKAHYFFMYAVVRVNLWNALNMYPVCCWFSNSSLFEFPAKTCIVREIARSRRG